MEINETFKADNLIAWTISFFLFMLLIRWIRNIAGWLLMKLYEFFIGNKDHAAPF